jgi:hypothetical protein
LPERQCRRVCRLSHTLGAQAESFFL